MDAMRDPGHNALFRSTDLAMTSSLPRISAIALACAALLAGPAIAADASVEARLTSRGMQYKLDEDGDYKVIYAYQQEHRSQQVFVSGRTEQVSGLTIREVFSPAGRLSVDGIDGAKALSLLAGSRKKKIGSWELEGDVLLFVIKLPDTVDGATLEAAMDLAAETADNKEIELSGNKDDL
ncbi:MAG TPA: hypothetical protein VGE22_14990 [Solimonas sp.]